MTYKHTVVLEMDIEDPKVVHELLCKAIHETDPDASQTLMDSVLDITMEPTK